MDGSAESADSKAKRRREAAKENLPSDRIGHSSTFTAPPTTPSTSGSITLNFNNHVSIVFDHSGTVGLETLKRVVQDVVQDLAQGSNGKAV
jgi:RNA 3'-terminal phosphate cyclase